MKFVIVILFIVVCVIQLNAQNLLVNPSAELGDPASLGWTNVAIGSTGASCYNNSGWRIIGNQNGFPAAQQGSFIFYAGCSPTNGSTFELRQDVNVSAYATSIDAGLNSFTFSGYMQVFNQSTPDQSQMIVEYRNLTNTVVLFSYNTGLQSDIGSWKFYTNTKIAPTGTRFIRVRLKSVVNTGPSIDGYFDNLTLSTNIILPVVISAFDVIAGNGQAKLHWTTTSEFNNSYFTIQRSVNAIAWMDIKKIDGSGNSNTLLNYVSVDESPLTGISYYRLKQTDIDGNSSYSEIKTISIAKENDDVTIFPNPAKSLFTVRGDHLKNVHLTLFNSTGQRIIRPEIMQDNKITVDVSGMNRGIYFVRLDDGQNINFKKIVVE